MTDLHLSTPTSAAVVSRHGATLRSLSASGRPLVLPFVGPPAVPNYRNAVLAPWPNRLADGRYAIDGVEHRLPINEPANGSALHGLVFDRTWTVEESESDHEVTLMTSLRHEPGYPYDLDMAASYALHETGLAFTLEATNIGPEVAPYGAGWHPYLVAGQGRVDDWALRLWAARYVPVDDAFVPLPMQATAGSAYDFRPARPIGSTVIDNAFTGLQPDDDGLVRVQVTGPDGFGAELAWDPRAGPWVQVHTGDRDDPDSNRAGIAVEPMTCPPHALRTGLDLVHLEPGQTHRLRITIEAINPDQ